MVRGDVQYQGLWRSTTKTELDWLDEEDVSSRLVEAFKALTLAFALGGEARSRPDLKGRSRGQFWQFESFTGVLLAWTRALDSSTVWCSLMATSRVSLDSLWASVCVVL